MRCVYSVVRFVPDTARGERVNVGVIVGCEETEEWTTRQVANLARARKIDDEKVSEAVGCFFEYIGREIDAHALQLEAGTQTARGPSEEWLSSLYHDQQNLVQLTAPAPISAESVEDAVDKIFSIMVIDPLHRRFEFAKRSRAVARLREAYTAMDIRRGVNLREKVTLRTPHFHEAAFDFAVMNGRVIQLAQSWSFQVPNQEEVASAVRAWGWTVHDLRAQGGKIALDNSTSQVISRDVEVAAVCVPPQLGEESSALKAALTVFEELDVNYYPDDRAQEVAARARSQLVDHGG